MASIRDAAEPTNLPPNILDQTHTLLGVLDDTRLLRIVRTLVDVLQINSVTFLFESKHEELSTFSLTYSLSLPLLHFGFQHGYLQRMLGLDWAGLGWVGWIRTRTEGGLLAF